MKTMSEFEKEKIGAIHRRATTSLADMQNRSVENSFVCARRGSSLFPRQEKRGMNRDRENLFSPESNFIGTSILSSSPIALSEEKRRKIVDSLMNRGSPQLTNSEFAKFNPAGGFDSPSSLNSSRSERRCSSLSKDEGYVTANEKSCLEDSGLDNSFTGRAHSSSLSAISYNINKVSMWRNSGGSSLNCSPHDTKKDHRARSCSTNTFLNSEAGLSLRNRSEDKTYHPASPETPLLARQKIEIERFIQEVRSLKGEVLEQKALVSTLSHDLKETRSKCSEIQDQNLMAAEEIQAYQFMNSLQEQRLEELEGQISSNRMERNELLSTKSKKHKATIRKMQHERAEYENRANTMIQQMTEQMTQLQKMAMGRIELLEKELMDQRHSADKWQSETINLKSQLAKALAVARAKGESNDSPSTGDGSPKFGPNGTLTSPLVRFKLNGCGNRRSSTSHGRSSIRSSTCSTRSSVTVIHGSDDNEENDCNVQNVSRDRLNSSFSEDEEDDPVDPDNDEDEEEDEDDTEDAMDYRDCDGEEGAFDSSERGGSPVNRLNVAQYSPTTSTSVVAAALKRIQQRQSSSGRTASESEKAQALKHIETNAAAHPAMEVDVWNVYI